MAVIRQLGWFSLQIGVGGLILVASIGSGAFERLPGPTLFAATAYPLVATIVVNLVRNGFRRLIGKEPAVPPSGAETWALGKAVIEHRERKALSGGGKLRRIR